ncbi:unnamed protein product [Kluyveromyces dobzhanskii CBS 2104]|uniref:Ataxin-10 homolog n=1 Tax=Kluyveromyces dobzhanskii CBS 2104 TaxID=1427455 RepID=A0A0A8L4S0_9SACH|nr:unnamed protein product [Kluyveromyces dobzhanskii CBS 2104]
MESIVPSINSLFKDAPSDSNAYTYVIDQLKWLIKETTQENKRNDISSSRQTFFDFQECANIGRTVDLKQACTTQYIRVFKAIVIVLRNLSVANQVIPQEILLPSTMIQWYLSVSNQSVYSHDDMRELYKLICQFNFNCTRNDVVFDESSFENHILFLMDMLNFINDDDSVNAFSLWLANFIKNDAFLSMLLNDRRSFAIIDDILINGIMAQKTEILSLTESKSDALNDLSSLAILQFRIIRQIITHESFGSYLRSLCKNKGFDSFNTTIKVAAMLVTSSENWDHYQITAILNWVLKTFEEYTMLVESFFSLQPTPNSTQAPPLFEILFSTLDILTSMAQYSHAQKYMVTYDGVQKVVKLFDILERNCLKIQFNKPSGSAQSQTETRNLKATDYRGNVVTSPALIDNRIHNNTVNDSNFPGIKCFLVELLGFLAYQRKEVQDSIRELHGLELVLSNCIIDDNNPFIKERCIVCIRYLLDNNQENQEFICKLEAKKAVDDEVLQKAGYKMGIDGNGNVKLVADEVNIVSEQQLLEKINE